MGVVLWDGNERWLFPLTKVGNKRTRPPNSGMNQGDLPSFQGVMTIAHEGLKKSTANLKHIIVFSDGDPGPPSPQLMQAIVGDKITVSTVLIAGHAGPQTMIAMADQGKGRFYDVRSPDQLPQIFIKEAAVILKSAIFEEPFKPQQVANSAVLRGISAGEYPQLRGYVATSRKPAPRRRCFRTRGSFAGALAIWFGPRSRFYLGCQGEMGDGLARVGKVPAVLVTNRAMEFAQGGRRRLYDGHFRRERPGDYHGRSARSPGQLSELSDLANGSGQPQGRAIARAPGTDRAGYQTRLERLPRCATPRLWRAGRRSTDRAR
jgi:hypothetical protein